MEDNVRHLNDLISEVSYGLSVDLALEHIQIQIQDCLNEIEQGDGDDDEDRLSDADAPDGGLPTAVADEWFQIDRLFSQTRDRAAPENDATRYRSP